MTRTEVLLWGLLCLLLTGIGFGMGWFGAKHFTQTTYDLGPTLKLDEEPLKFESPGPAIQYWEPKVHYASEETRTDA